LDLKALQATLRQFAATRDWQPFHTPKNLAMALMVEAAELAEIFQWMTPEQSQAAATDAALRERVADEVADVLLYLVQIADHTGVDLKRAVGRKLVRNDKKHPPVRPGLPSGSSGPPQVETHVLVDWENVRPNDTDIRTLVPEVTDVWLFHGPGQKAVGARLASFGDRLTLVKTSRAGKNSLDMHLSFYMGHIAACRPEARFVVISNDQDYLPMLEHAAERGFAARLIGWDAAAAKAAAKSSPAKKAAPAAKKVAAKKTPVNAAASKPTPKPTAKPKSTPKPTPKPDPASKAAPAPASEPAPAPAKTPVKNAAAPQKSAAKTSPAKKKPASGQTVAAVGTDSPGTKGGSVPDLNKAVAHVIASLKSMNRPTRQARLLSTVKSLLGPAASEQVVTSVLAQLLASGKVSLDAAGAVRYAL
jgi:NTP pyrophosphatase (non-canonical NTP hydrolase)